MVFTEFLDLGQELLLMNDFGSIVILLTFCKIWSIKKEN